MTPQRWGAVSAAGLGLVGALLNVFQLSHVTSLSSDALAATNVAVASGAAFVGVLFTKAPGTPPTP